MDRFDLSIEVPLLPQGACKNGGDRGESSAQVRSKILQVREIQLARAGKINAYLTGKEIERDCGLSCDGCGISGKCLDEIRLSVRAYHRILKVARTICDLNGDLKIEQAHLAEALGYRAMDRLLQKLSNSLT